MKNTEMMLSKLDLSQTFEAIQSTLLSIYDQIILTDLDGTILYVLGTINQLWGDSPDSIVAKNLIELEKKHFYDCNQLEHLLAGKQTTMIKTAWNEQKIMFSSRESSQGIISWTLTNISQPTDETMKLSSASNQTSINESQIPFIFRSQKMKEIFTTIKQVSQVPTTILLLGDSGVGKEVVAKTIHQIGIRKDKPFIAVNCGAIPESLLESELFGYTDGAFSGAKKGGAPGKFELADQGILFLDEIGEIPINLQVKLLRALQEKQITRLGDSVPKNIDIQIIAATNQSLSKMVAEGKFREDLYYRLNVIPIQIPPLNERGEEIPYLIYHFQNKYNETYNRNVTIEKDAIDLLTISEWPGNVRQLENTIERIIVTSTQDFVGASNLQSLIEIESEQIKTPPIIDHIMPLPDALELVEEQLVTMAMKRYNSFNLAAKALGISQPTMSRKYKKIKTKQQQSNDFSINRRNTLEAMLDSRLRSVAIAAASIIKPEDVMELISNYSESNLIFQKLQSNLTSIVKHEGSIQWTFIMEILPNGKFKTLVADKDFVMKPGVIYDSSKEFIEIAKKAVKGKVEVTPIYRDIFGAWKTTLAPIFNQKNEVIALIGFDYSEEYVQVELSKLANQLKIEL